MDTITTLWQTIRHPFKAYKHRNILKQIKTAIEGKVTDSFLELLLEGMSLIFFFDKNFRRNIKGFNAKYQFKDRNGGIEAGAEFFEGRMEVDKGEMPNPDVAVEFKDAQALRDFLFSGNPDILDFVLNNRLKYEGNLNYILKFGYMARHLQLALLKV